MSNKRAIQLAIREDFQYYFVPFLLLVIFVLKGDFAWYTGLAVAISTPFILMLCRKYLSDFDKRSSSTSNK